MKGFLVLLACLLISFATQAQVYVDGEAIDTVRSPFCQLVCQNATILSRTKVIIDYGQRFVDSGLNRQKIAGPDQKPVAFNSNIDALNFMIRNGWELVSSQVLSTEPGDIATFIYLLRYKAL